ncbi:LacI family transcriptional regulator [Arthrobacter psychrolactophilus]|uniref:LacI family transcriptional regulator n=1 Tax=Arthrobacter psychrolactophilus TaxID=92442 RepID=A0A2V5IYF6_9MICC|nr:LacI family DNA-binding transcriptional regulator [Arthrobacter psychrolactophilus]PYI39404.1 LacI family transcriptional regulator [Arthrobacter psychrolactophilus]
MTTPHHNSLVEATPPTLDEVAAAAGVSRSTASRALNGGLRVSPAAQASVDAAAKLLGYLPNRAARSLVTRRTDSIALVIPEPDERVLSDPFIGATLRGISAALASTDQQLVLLLARPDEDGGRIAKYLRSGYVDGAVIVSHHRQDGLEEAVLGSRIPAVFVGRPFHDEDLLHYIDVDSVAGGRLATEYLLNLGRRRIAHIAGPQDMTAGNDRAQGWRDALREANLADDLIAQGNFTKSTAYQAMNDLLRQDPTIDAVFVASDLMAEGALTALREHGRSVPDDVAVIGFDDLGGAANTSPTLTTVRNPVVEMATSAVEQLLHLLSKNAAPRETPIPLVFFPQLVIRNSTPGN